MGFIIVINLTDIVPFVRIMGEIYSESRQEESYEIESIDGAFLCSSSYNCCNGMRFNITKRRKIRGRYR